jgi:hypothetical protein
MTEWLVRRAQRYMCLVGALNSIPEKRAMQLTHYPVKRKRYFATSCRVGYCCGLWIGSTAIFHWPVAA